MIKTKWNTLFGADQRFGSCYKGNKTDPKPLTRAVLCGNGKMGIKIWKNRKIEKWNYKMGKWDLEV